MMVFIVTPLPSTLNGGTHNENEGEQLPLSICHGYHPVLDTKNNVSQNKEMSPDFAPSSQKLVLVPVYCRSENTSYFERVYQH
uniref:Uncharacterized protein n=1 Tax=Lactuca sativa TaxID=4236 RepID=A0A9R1VND1_LACSA|nr:hypothetical protein LSAT_V11C500245010 [Lactuca sativa]